METLRMTQPLTAFGASSHQTTPQLAETRSTATLDLAARQDRIEATFGLDGVDRGATRAPTAPTGVCTVSVIKSALTFAPMAPLAF